MTADDPVTEHIKQEARVAGLRDFRTPSLEAVEKRRLQLWILTAALLVSISLGVVFVSTWQTSATRAFAATPVMRIAVVLLSIAFCIYVIDKERHLRKLSRLLIDERVLTTALSNRLREVELLLGAGKAMNDVLELSVVLNTMLGSAVELLDSDSGSVMLMDGGHLVVASSHGNEHADGGKVRLGEGIAGHVASTREALLVQGKANAGDFPGLVPHEMPVTSAISAPLIHREELLGVLNVNSTGDRLFSEFDLRAVSLFAEQAATAIANARLYEVERAALGLGTMVEALLAAAELEGGEAARRFEPVALAKVVREAAADHSVLGRDLQVAASQPAVVVCDREYVRRILDNLIDNAFKYGQPPVRIVVTGDSGHVGFTVLDAGRGVAAEDRERVFDRFHRLDSMS